MFQKTALWPFGEISQGLKPAMILQLLRHD